MKKSLRNHLLTLFFLLLTMITASCSQKEREGLPVLKLGEGWAVQSSDSISVKNGEIISNPGFDTGDWYRTTVPSTVLAVLVDNGVYPDPYFGMNLRSIPGTDYPLNKNFSNLSMSEASPFRVPWWYRTEFIIPPEFDGKELQLHFKGINFRANIWLNGKLLADSTEVAGTFRIYEFDITGNIVDDGLNTLAVEVIAPRKDDLAITWVEWNPAPPDKNMGIWHEVFISASGQVTLRHPQVITDLDLPSTEMARLTVTAELNNQTEEVVTGILKGQIEDIRFEKEVVLGPRESSTIEFKASEYEQLNIKNPRLWWPVHYGDPELYRLNLSFEAGGRVSDSGSVSFGIREITSELTDDNHLLFRVNGEKILIRGGGWASDMMLRDDPARLLTQIEYVKDMNLNTIRLEGKLESDYFYELCDRYGILAMPGWCCCDQWEEWDEWDEEDHSVAALSLKDQVKRLRSHACILTWLYGSDYPPVPEVEKMYLGIFKENNWPNPYQSSAALKPTDVTGYSGIRMEGPYFYTEPSYWLTDTARGGAFGFNAEIGPGASVPVLESILSMFPEDKLWPVNDYWHFHGRGGNPASMLDMDNKALSARYGEARNLEDYIMKSQMQAYEGKRAMFEAYARNKYTSTGVIQWMLNNAWPGVYWNLYDYFLRTGGSYFGTKKACEPLHIQYSYDDRSVVAVNSQLRGFENLKARVTVLNFDLSEKYSEEKSFSIGPDGVERIMYLPQIPDLSVTWFVKLEMKDENGRIISNNFYWLSTVKEKFDWEKSYFWATPMLSYPDFTLLQTLPEVGLEISSNINEISSDSDTITVTVSNPSGNLAFGVYLKLVEKMEGKEIIPVLWEDNYFPLLPGEERQITARFRGKGLKEKSPEVVAGGWNVI